MTRVAMGPRKVTSVTDDLIRSSCQGEMRQICHGDPSIVGLLSLEWGSDSLDQDNKPKAYLSPASMITARSRLELMLTDSFCCRKAESLMDAFLNAL